MRTVVGIQKNHEDMLQEFRGYFSRSEGRDEERRLQSEHSNRRMSLLTLVVIILGFGVSVVGILEPVLLRAH